MSSSRRELPQLDGSPFLSDGGLETHLIFQEGLSLPCFAAFPLLETEAGRALLKSYFERHLAIAEEHGMGFLLDTPTWRASKDWGDRLGISAERLDMAHKEAVELAKAIRKAHETEDTLIVINGVVGPRGDGYRPDTMMSPKEAYTYHRPQIESFAATDVDMLTAMTMTHTGEAIGLVEVAADLGLPIAISFTTETDGRLPTGETLGEAIEMVDNATDAYAAYYMVNCAHPSHFVRELDARAPWARRIRGIRANASKLSHAELDEATELDAGDPEAFAEDYSTICGRHPWINILGGCCGTDERHIRAVSARLRTS
jgi:homocysteine S-methyltransferase